MSLPNSIDRLSKFLKKLGCHRAKALVKRFPDAKEKSERYDVSALSHKEFLRMAEAERLMLVRGIGARWAMTLQRVGIETVEELSEMTPDVVRMKLDLLSASTDEKVSHMPSKMTIADWIIDASRLRRKSQPTATGRNPSCFLRLMCWMGIDPEPFKPYVRDESLELEIALTNARLRYGFQVMLRTLFFFILLSSLIGFGYLVISNSMIAAQHMDLPEFLRFVLMVLAGGFGLTFFLIGIDSLLLLLLHICYSSVLAMKCFTDRAVSKLVYRDKDNICLFAVRWSRACWALMRGTLRRTIGIIFVVFLASNIILLLVYDGSDLITLDHAIIPLLIAIVLIPGLVGVKTCASDSALLRWVAKHPRSSNMFFGSNVDDVRRWHVFVIKGRVIEAIRSLCCLILAIGMIIVGTTLIIILHDKLFVPAIQIWMELIGFGTSKLYYYRVEISELWVLITQSNLSGAIFVGFVIFSFFYIVIPYLTNRGRGFLLSFVFVLCIGLICDFTIGGIRTGLAGLDRVYYVLTVVCVYLLFKLMEAILSKKIERIDRLIAERRAYKD